MAGKGLFRRAGWTAFAITTLIGGVAATTGRAEAAPIASAPHSLGLVMDPRPPMTPSIAHRLNAASAALPASVDLTPLAPPVGNQGPVGSCAAWASDYTALGYWLDYDNEASTGYLAPMYTYSQVDGGTDNGSSIGANLQIAQTQGVDIRSDYSQGDFDWSDQPTAHETANAANWKLTSYEELPVMPGPATVTQKSVEEALASGTPVVIGIPVFYNFETLTSADDGLYNSVSGPLLGYHAVTALGYDATGLRVENSWTPGWGDSGFATLSWSFVNGYVVEAVAVGNLVPAASTAGQFPVITNHSVKAVTTGTRQVTLDGTNLSGASVTVAGTNSVVISGSAESVTFLAPSEPPGSYPAAVSTDQGTASFDLEYVAAAPTISSESPSSGPTEGWTKVTISGQDLESAAVTIGGVGARVVSISPTSIVLYTPAYRPGREDVVVTTPGGKATASFTYVAAPRVTSTTPLRSTPKGGARVTLNGINLAGAKVAISGTSITGVSHSGTSLTFTTPARALPHKSRSVTATLSVATAGGTVRLPFIYSA